MIAILFAATISAEPVRPFLNMPPKASGAIPSRLSGTGAFADMKGLVPAPGLVSYELNVPFWSDGADKQRWMALPAGTKISFSPTAEWGFPAGTVFVKHFQLGSQRIETRLLVRTLDGGVYGVSYRWRPDHTDADLVSASQRVDMTTDEVSGTRPWFFPGPQDCLKCHTPAVKVLGVNTRQLNRAGPTGLNQLVSWSNSGALSVPVRPAHLTKLPRLFPIHDRSTSLANRARSYLDANCGFCHRPGGAVADFDARFDTPLERQLLVDAPARINLGLDHARQIASNDPWRSLVLVRAQMVGQTGMPPLAHERIDEAGSGLLRRWVESLPAPPTLEPPTITLKSGDFAKPIDVEIKHSDRDAVVRYTVDGAPPTANSSAYQRPLKLTTSTTLRARAYRPGFTSSIVVTETFIINDER
jgi:uncharacterized repeat protein (TIGR03806 family)